jgi:lipoprotein-anchoring transpeptidase ErfK/SrfK
LLLFAVQFLAAAVFAQDNQIWILVDTTRLTVTVMEGEQVRRTYNNISIGRGGTTRDKRRNDDKTPLGEYHIVRIAAETPFHRFFGFDYPTLDQAGRALQAGAIDQRQYAQIRKAIRSKEVPPQATPLGGFIGIHGVGAGDVRVHGDFNWTNGCIALTNEQIDDLARWIGIGTRVVIQ